MVANFERTVTSQVISPLSKLGVTSGSSSEFKELDMDDINPTYKSCREIADARELLQAGLTASRKAAKGQKSHHLMITVQPVFDGKYYGDKIAIVDMAGIEKHKRNGHHHRGKDSVPNANQAANGAVLHCLRTLIYNTNVKSGKRGGLDIVCPDDDDDLVSEISNVSSQAYNKRHQQQRNHRLKPVPFRQHQVTMAMKPFLTSRASAKVTLLLAAYPGHADYSEKKSLLQDLELLCGSALLSSNTVAETGFEETNKAHEQELESQVSIDNDSTDQDPIRLPYQRSTSIHKRSQNSGKASYLGFSNAPSAPVRVKSLDDDDEEAKISMPPAYAPTSRREAPKAYSRWLTRPSAPPEEIAEPLPSKPEKKVPVSRPLQSKPGAMSDFPGVKLPSKRIENSPVVERMKAETIAFPSSTVGGPRSKTPPSSDDMSWVSQEKGHTSSSENRYGKFSDIKRPLQPSLLQNVETKQIQQPRKPPMETKSISMPKEALISKSTERRQVQTEFQNSYLSMQPKQLDENPTSKTRVLHQMERSQRVRESDPSLSEFDEPMQEPHLPSPMAQRTTRKASVGRKRKDNPGQYECESNTQNKRGNQNHEELVKKVELLEARLKETIQQKNILHSRCQQLEKENNNLKSSTHTVGRENILSSSSVQEEQEYQQSRKMRLEDQTLIKQPLMLHFESVNKVYDIKNQWCKSQKPHFGLQFPGNFKRAPDLDIRDKAKEEALNFDGTGSNQITTSSGAVGLLPAENNKSRQSRF